MSAPVRIPPHDRHAELSLLGGALLNNDYFWAATENVRASDFYVPAHREIWSAMEQLALESQVIDVVTLGDALHKAGKLDEVGGVGYIGMLDTHVPATAAVERYAKIVSDKAAQRRLAIVGREISEDALTWSGDVDQLLDSAGQRVLDASQRQNEAELKPVKSLIREVYAEIEQRYENQQEVTGLPTGINALDKMTAGFQRGDLIVIGGRPSMGKTSVAMQFAMHITDHTKEPGAVFSLEMTDKRLTQRLLASESRVALKRIRTGRLLDTDFAKLARGSDAIFRSGIFIDDKSGKSIVQIMAAARRFKLKHGKLSVIVVDYLQLMTGSGNSQNREQEIAEISRGLKAIAKNLDCVVIALSQLNRSLERREDKRPVMSDLRESGQVEQDADIILFVYRDEVYHPDTNEKGIAELIAAKQRDGEIGTVKTAFIGEYVRFENLAEDRDDPRAEWG